MAMADPVAGWLEMAQLYEGESPAAKRCQEILGAAWLPRYPRPQEIGFDNGSEFKKEFRDLCKNMGTGEQYLKKHYSKYMTRLSLGELIKVRSNYGIEVSEGNDFVLGDELLVG